MWNVCACTCVFVCLREREREMKKGKGESHLTETRKGLRTLRVDSGTMRCSAHMRIFKCVTKFPLWKTIGKGKTLCREKRNCKSGPLRADPGLRSSAMTTTLFQSSPPTPPPPLSPSLSLSLSLLCTLSIIGARRAHAGC